VLPAGWSLGDVPDVPSTGRSLDGEWVTVLTTEPLVATQRITTWAVEHGLDVGHFSVTQPTLEDIYLELTGAAQDSDTATMALAR
jgi:ABC-2 type transport system ATP-binding protein